MKTHSPLYFPDSIVTIPVKLSMASIFDTVQILSPTNEESDPPLPEFVDPFTENNFCQVHIPCPFPEEDEKRFLHLVKEIRTQGKDFITQLKMLTLSSFTSFPNNEKESSSAILKALFPTNNQAQQQVDEKETLELWQARLVLKLAEILDIEEITLSERLNAIEHLESKMLKQLCGDDDSSVTDTFTHQSASPPGNQKQENITGRMKAWTTLYQYWQAEDIPIWITSRPAAADFVFEKYEKSSGNEPRQFFQAVVPANNSVEKSVFDEKIVPFRSNVLRTQIQDLLFQLVTGTGNKASSLPDVLTEFADIKSGWLKTIDHHFPEKEYERANIVFYLLHDAAFPDIFNKKRGSHTPASYINSIVAVVSPL